MPNPRETVDQFMARLDHPLKAEIETIRALVLGANTDITEHIKWNAPSFCVGGDDRVTLKLHPPSKIQVVFHRGAKVKAREGFVLEDDSGLLKWAAVDRAIATFVDMQDIETKRETFTRLVDRWVNATR